MALFEKNWPRKRLQSQLIWFALWTFVTTVAAFLKPDPHHHGTHTQLGLPPCPSVLLFHRPCPGCGLTTSWTAFVHGNLAESFRAHPLGPLLYLAFTATALIGMYGWVTEQRLRTETKSANFGLMGTLAAVLLVGAFRFATTVYDDPYASSLTNVSPRAGEQSRNTARVPEKYAAADPARTSKVQ